MEFHGKVELAPNKQSTCQEQRAYKKRRSKKPISNKVFVFLSISKKNVDQNFCILCLYEPEVKRFYREMSVFDDTLMVVLTFFKKQF